MKKCILLAIALCCSTISYSNIHYKHISHNKTTQTLFDKGMLNYYGYLYVQAEYDFRQALNNDPACGMCYWGLAIAKKHQALELGQSFASVGYADIQKAVKLVSRDAEFQYDVVHAAVKSFSLDPKITSNQLQFNYISELRKINQKYKNNVEWREESLALFVDAIAYYFSSDDASLNHCGHSLNEIYKQEAVGLLRKVLNDKSYPDHPGLIHTYIHMTERDLDDPLGEVMARKLPAFSQGKIAHYTHMPNHIFWRRGMYDKAIKANLDTIAIDQNYFAHGGAGLNSYYYEFHYLHSFQFLAVLGVLTNNFELAIENARAVKNKMDVNRLEKLKDFRDVYLSLEHLVLARFKKWNEVLQLEIPSQTNEMGLLFIHFSKALAYLNLGQENSYKKWSSKIQNEKYQRQTMRDFQTLILTYLKSSEMNLKNASVLEMEKVFLKNGSGDLERKLFTMNPPAWLFPYELLLAEAAKSRNDLIKIKKHYAAFGRIYPHSTLGAPFPVILSASEGSR